MEFDEQFDTFALALTFKKPFYNSGFFLVKAGANVKLFIKLHQTGEFDEKFDAFELIIKHDFFKKLKKKKSI